MKTLILFTIALAAYGQQVCITNTKSETKCRAITAEAWNAAQDFKTASCKDVTDAKGVVTNVCQYKSVPDVIFQHVAGYLNDLKAAHPQPALKALKAAQVAAETAAKAESAKEPLGAEK